MKVILPQNAACDPNQDNILQFSASTDGTVFETFLPVDNCSLKDFEFRNQVTTTTLIRVHGTSETTSKGVSRVMLKVEIPYAAIRDVNHTSPTIQDLTYDPASSGGVCSIHTVLTMPAQAVKDLKGTTSTQSGVINSVAILRSLMSALLHAPIVEDGQVAFATEPALIGYGENVGSALGPITIQTSLGLSVVDSNTGATTPTLAAYDITRDPLIRGLRGVKPLASM